MAQWWNEWQLRILVLASLCAQYLLLYFAMVRKSYISPRLRFLFRLAHLGSDALAIFVLATLFNRQKGGPHCSYARGSRTLELFWAPIVLMHLGGQVVITTYKIQDNEQWSRHILTSLSKVTVALYVFYKSWSSNDKRLLAATILFFILVTIRCFQKALGLKSSSFNSLRKASSSKDNIIRGTNVTEGQLANFITAAKKLMEPVDKRQLPKKRRARLPYQLFLDLPSPYSDRIEALNRFWSFGLTPASVSIDDTLSEVTNFLYTKDGSTSFLALKNSPAELKFRRWTIALAFATLITAICLVHTSREAYSGEDTWVTLVLLYGTLVLELIYLFVRPVTLYNPDVRLFQHNLIGLLAHNKLHSKPRLRHIAGWLQCKDLLDQYSWHMESSGSGNSITELVLHHIEIGWKEIIVDPKSYRRFNDTRGELTLAKNGYFRRVGWSIQRPFDESIVLWHLATDLLCILRRPALAESLVHVWCKRISDYMMHLLFENPEMLMPGSRKSLFTRAYDELKEIFKDDKTPRVKTLPVRENMIFAKEVIQKCKAGSIPDSFVGDAWLLVQGLLDHAGADNAKLWEVVKGVWVEMLCFSAGRSRGYLHAEALGTGAEYLSHVWLMLAHAGMETFSDKLQRRDDVSFDSDEPYPLAREIRRTRSF